LVNISQKISKAEYLETVNQLKAHILKGDCYEINYCMEFYAKNVSIDPLLLYQHLSDLSPNPFAAFYRVQDKYLLCASPERFIKKTGRKIISQPIKGTASRIPANAQEDEQIKHALINSEKDKAENVMVVDLVRNDLSKICIKGSVKATELFGVYTFPQVYQMISTIEGELIPETNLCEIIEATFPMGSMTGAPKRRVMQLIEQYEKTRRGIYSGAVGYISPSGDFDFNVVIRSIMMNLSNEYLSYQVGSAITYNCDALQEWHECINKVSAIKKVLSF
jgi:para-aminobenzoate synthetase component 1